MNRVSFGSDYLNPCWVIVICALTNKLQCNFNHNTKRFIHENAYEYIVYEMAYILSRERWVNTARSYVNILYICLWVQRKVEYVAMNKNSKNICYANWWEWRDFSFHRSIAEACQVADKNIDLRSTSIFRVLSHSNMEYTTYWPTAVILKYGSVCKSILKLILASEDTNSLSVNCTPLF